MGWQRDDWSSVDEIELEEDEIQQARHLELDEVRKIDPYTIHRHPVFISSTALSYLRASWEHFMRHNRKQPETSLSWSYCASLADAERDTACLRQIAWTLETFCLQSVT